MTIQRTSDFKRPFNDLTKYIPSRLKNELNTSLMDNLFNRFMTQNESVPFYGYIGESDSNKFEAIPQLPQNSFEREVNQIVPVLTFKHGAEQVNYTVQDLVNQATSMGVAGGGSEWMYTQANNFAPPIDFDKFVNFTKYYWMAPTSYPLGSLAWNPLNAPEYYVIAQPEPTDKDKKNVRVATTGITTLTGSGFVEMDFVIEFVSDTEFNITPTSTLGDYQPVRSSPYEVTERVQTFEYVVSDSVTTKTMLTFTIECDQIFDFQGNEVGYGSFETGDKFIITAPFITTQYQVNFTGGYGVKGKITKVRSLREYQHVDGIALKEGDRVLVKDTSGDKAGIYIVSSGMWQRAEDSLSTINQDGARVWVREGVVNGQYMFTGVMSTTGLGWIKSETTTAPNTNDWQEGNFWVHEDNINYGEFDLATATQATLPIIEYKGSLELNTFVDTNGIPSDKGHTFRQKKTAFNQLPLFNLYRYDGTHAGLVSPLFFYEESPVGTLENSLQKRIKREDNSSNDLIFNHGMYDPVTGNLLFAKSSGDLVSIWSTGYTTATVAAQSFVGKGDGKISSITITNPETFQQRWSIEFKTEKTFGVIGDRTGETEDGVVGNFYDNGEISFTITEGTVVFEAGDKFTVTVGNLERPGYVEKLSDGTLKKHTNEVGDGAWEISKTFYNNPYSENRSPLIEGSLNLHFRSILASQTAGYPMNTALGGEIKLWGEQHGMMASLLMQRDLTPNSMIELAEKMYDNSLNNIKEIYQQDVVDYLGTVGSIKSIEDVSLLLDYILDVNAKSDLARNVLFDSTSPVKGFPVTLPQMACAELHKPGLEFSPTLGIEVIRHHDGHLSEVFENGIEFNQTILGNLTSNLVLRSDGKSTPAIGSFTNVPPSNPYRGELWSKPTGEILTFHCTYDLLSPTPAKGDIWYDRVEEKAFQFDGSDWNEISKDDLWVSINFASVLNNLIIELETRLYNGINPNARKIDFSGFENVPEFQKELKDQLYTFAALNGYDPSGTDYDPLNPLTWNYSSVSLANSAPVINNTVPARWFDYLTAHQQTVPGVIPTLQPHAEPWKLFGFQDGYEWWISLTPEKQAAYTPEYQLQDIAHYTKLGNVVAVLSSHVDTLYGENVIDGVRVSTGDKVLVINNGALDGVWTVSSAQWSKVDYTLTTASYITILQGGIYTGSFWVTVDGTVFKQARTWTLAMWDDIVKTHPTLKLSVNVFHDKFLPPYVPASSPVASFGLTNITVPGASNIYEYGQNSPVEAIWKQTTNYLYSRVRALFRFDPLVFLGMAWGFNWVDVNGILYDGIDLSMPGVKRTRLHGDPLNIIGNRKPLTVEGSVEETTFIYTAYDTDRAQSFTVYQGGVVVGYVQEGKPSVIGGMTVLIEDAGIPFSIGDTIKLNVDGNVVFVPIGKNSIMGFGQIFTNALRSANVDTNRSYALTAYKGWEVKMGYRVGGLASTEDLTVSTLLRTLTPSSYDLVFKKNLAAFDTWLQSLRISVATFGAANVESDTSTYRPVGDASDWVFKIEGFNPRHSRIQYYKLDNGKELVTFKSLMGTTTDRIWYQPTEKVTKERHEVQLPIQIKGLQNVVDFLFGYTMVLDEDGWVFNNGPESSTDAETGRTRTMQLEIEKLINVIYKGITPVQGSIINPFIDRVWLKQPRGMISPFRNSALFDIQSHPGVFDVLGVKYNKEDLNIVRTNEISSIGSTGPMFSVHAQLDEYEHLFIFENWVEPSIKDGLLYDPFTGSRVLTYQFNGQKQASAGMRPEYGGHYLVGSEVRKNLQTSTDVIQNLYDVNHVYEDKKTTKEALALLGFEHKKYFDDIDISSKSQFNFWRGLIQSKGSNNSIDAYLNNGRFDDAKIDEYWAYKIAEYGDARPRTFPEMRISVNDVANQTTQLQFVKVPAPVAGNITQDVKLLPGFTEIKSDDESRWFSFDDLDTDLWFTSDLIDVYSSKHKIGDIVKLNFIADNIIYDVDNKIATNYEYINSTTVRVTGVDADGVFTIKGYGPARPKFNPVKLFNYQDGELIEEIPVWNPAMGVFTPAALGAINIISDKDPASYNMSTQVAANVSYDPLRPWSKREVGRTWLNTTNLKFVPYFDSVIFPDMGERLARWGALTDYGSVDVYEWVQSPVPPSEYNLLSLAQAGNADLDNSVKAGGEVANPKLNMRQRKLEVYPVAWSFSPVATDTNFGDTPPMISATTSLRFENGLAILGEGAFSNIGDGAFVPGLHIGAWLNDGENSCPVNEYEVTDAFTKVVVDTSGAEREPAAAEDQGFKATVSLVSNPENYNPSLVGQMVFAKAPISATPNGYGDNGQVISYEIKVPLKASAFGVGISEEVVTMSGISPSGTGSGVYGATFPTNVGQQYLFELKRLGLSILVISDVTGDFPLDALRNVVVSVLNSNVVIQDAVSVNPIAVDDMGASYTTEEKSDTSALVAYGWKAWRVPTQADLDSDGFPPVVSWKAYIGKPVQVEPTKDMLAQASQYLSAPLTLNNGVVIPRYLSVWSDWVLLEDIKYESTQLEDGDFKFPEFENLIPENRLGVYINGALQLKTSYLITGKVLTVYGVKKGSEVVAIIRKYDPTPTELDFDPETDPSNMNTLVQYKMDYDFVEQSVRNDDGSVVNTVYYFWVKNKSTPASGKRMSIRMAATELAEGPDSYLTFQNYHRRDSNVIGGYDAITISGLSYVVTKDNTFKLRFTRDFTLRDDPDDLNLKNVHTEWSLIRETQRTRIPEKLWWKLVDSAVGSDAAGNAIPALRRELYDERHGTRTQFGFNDEQTLAPSKLLKVSLLNSILNTNQDIKVGDVLSSNAIEGLDYDRADEWFVDAVSTRNTLTAVWNNGTPLQVNAVFFGVLGDILASNYELTDMFKTSRLSAHSIKVVRHLGT